MLCKEAFLCVLQTYGTKPQRKVCQTEVRAEEWGGGVRGGVGGFPRSLGAKFYVEAGRPKGTAAPDRKAGDSTLATKELLNMEDLQARGVTLCRIRCQGLPCVSPGLDRRCQKTKGVRPSHQKVYGQN